MLLKGKQIADSSIPQSKMNITLDSIVNATSVVNKQYTDNLLADSALTKNTENIDMEVNVTTATGNELATAEQISQVPKSAVRVNVNGIEANVGNETQDWAFFSPNGTIVRASGTEKLGDSLYWKDTAPFTLEADDEMDFDYLTSSLNPKTYSVSAGDTIQGLTTNTQTVVFDSDTPGDEATFLLNGETITFRNESGQFGLVGYDSGGEPYTYNAGNGVLVWTSGEVGVTKTIVVGGMNYDFTFDGFGSFIMTIEPEGGGY